MAPLLLSHKNWRKKSINDVSRNIWLEEWDRTLPTFKEWAIPRLLVNRSQWGFFHWQLNSHTYYIFKHPRLWRHLFWSKIAIPPQNPLTGSHHHRPLERKLKKWIKSFKKSVLRTRRSQVQRTGTLWVEMIKLWPKVKNQTLKVTKMAISWLL